MSNDQWLELLKYLGFAVGLYMAIRVDMATLRVRVDHHEKEIARIDRALDK
jgi:hypothetical protein